MIRTMPRDTPPNPRLAVPHTEAGTPPTRETSGNDITPSDQGRANDSEAFTCEGAAHHEPVAPCLIRPRVDHTAAALIASLFIPCFYLYIAASGTSMLVLALPGLAALIAWLVTVVLRSIRPHADRIDAAPTRRRELCMLAIAALYAVFVFFLFPVLFMLLYVGQRGPPRTSFQTIIMLMPFLGAPCIMLGTYLLLCAMLRRKGNAPHCGHCNYELHLPPPPRCPECGRQPSRKHPLTIGAPSRSPGALLPGVAFTALSLLLLTPWLQPPPAATRLAPTPVLLWQAASGSAWATDEAWDELASRQVTAIEHNRLFGIMLRQFVQGSTWEGSTRVAADWLADQIENGTLTPDQLARMDEAVFAGRRNDRHERFWEIYFDQPLSPSRRGTIFESVADAIERGNPNNTLSRFGAEWLASELHHDRLSRSQRTRLVDIAFDLRIHVSTDPDNHGRLEVHLSHHTAFEQAAGGLQIGTEVLSARIDDEPISPENRWLHYARETGTVPVTTHALDELDTMRDTLTVEVEAVSILLHGRAAHLPLRPHLLQIDDDGEPILPDGTLLHRRVTLTETFANPAR